MKKIIVGLVFFSAGLASGADLPTDHTVTQKDTLWDLAGRYYHDPFKWPRIAEANPPPRVNDPHWIYPKQLIRIPALELGGEAPAPEPRVEAAAPAAPATPAATRAPAPVRPPKRTEPRLEEPPATEGVSSDFPKGIVGVYPFAGRFKAPAGWKTEGTILVDRKDGDRMWSQGDSVRMRVASGEIRAGERFSVFRKSGPTDVDEDQKGPYYVRIGIVEVRRKFGKVYEAEILESNDSVQAGDLLRRGD